MLRNKYHLGNGSINRDASRLRVIMASAAEQPVEVTDHGDLAGLADDDHSQYVHISADRTITSQHSISPINDQAPFLLGVHAQNQTVIGLKADYLDKTITAGNGLTGGGALTSDITLDITATDNTMLISASGIAVNIKANGGLLGTNGLEIDADDGIDVGANGVSVDCTDLLGAGISEDANNNFIVDVTADFNWTGTHTFSDVNLFGQTIAQHILPRYTDTYDLGSSTMLWRKGWLSELDAVIFAQNTVTLLGGWLLISKDEGALAANVVAADTQINFGKTMTVNDFVLFRAALKVEYMQVGALVSGTTYNVTRNLDGSGANDWPAGTPFCVLGTSGNGRLELNAYDTPRIQLLSQGANYNSQTELLRLGDLNGNWGYAAATYGLAIGEYASGKVNLTLEPTNSLRIRTYATTQFSVTPNLLKFGADVSAAGSTALAVFGANQTYNSESMGIGDLLIGDNTASKANILWDKSAGQLLIRGGTTTQVCIDTDGTIKFAAGSGKLNLSGVEITSSTFTGDIVFNNLNSYKFINYYTGDIIGGLFACVNVTSHDNVAIGLIVQDHTINTLFIKGGPVIIDSFTDIEIKRDTWIDTGSTIALLVEQDGVKDNVLVVDTTNGRVGVNCTPSYALDVKGSMRLIATSTSTNLSLEFYRLDNTKACATIYNPAGSLSASNVQFYVGLIWSGNYFVIEPYNGSSQWTALAVSATGNVGINDAAPAEILDVNGNINCTGVIKVDDVQVVNSRYYNDYANNIVSAEFGQAESRLLDAMRDCLVYHGLFAQTP